MGVRERSRKRRGEADTAHGTARPERAGPPSTRAPANGGTDANLEEGRGRRRLRPRGGWPHPGSTPPGRSALPLDREVDDKYVVIMTVELSSAGSPSVADLYAVIREVRRLFHRLANATDRLHREQRVTAAQRAILEELVELGDRSVPDLARAKGVTRQHVQVMANELLSFGLAAARANPAHRRSPLLYPTQAGRRVFEAMRSRENRLLQAVVERLPSGRLSGVAAILREIGDAVDEGLDRSPDRREPGHPSAGAHRKPRRPPRR